MSFSSALSGAGSGALQGASVGGPWGAAIGGGIGLLSGLFGGKAADPGGVSKDQANQLAGNLTSNVGTLGQTGANLGGFGMGQMQQGAGNLNDSANYFRGLLSGNRSTVQQTMAPQLSVARDQFNNMLKSTSTLNPRGGGRASTLFGQPAQQQGNLLSMYDTARSSAAPQLAQIGGMQGQLGGQASGQGIQAYGVANQSALGGLNNRLGVGQQTVQNSTALGQGTASLIKQGAGVDWSKIFGGNGVKVGDSVMAGG